MGAIGERIEAEVDDPRVMRRAQEANDGDVEPLQQAGEGPQLLDEHLTGLFVTAAAAVPGLRGVGPSASLIDLYDEQNFVLLDHAGRALDELLVGAERVVGCGLDPRLLEIPGDRI